MSDRTPFTLTCIAVQAVQTLGLSVLYAPILPLSPFIGVVAMLIHYATDQYVALRRSLKPAAFESEALAVMNSILRLLPLVQVRLLLCCSTFC